MISGLSIPTEDVRLLLPVCMFSINIPIYRFDSKSAVKLWDHCGPRTRARASRLVAKVRI